MQTFTQSDLQPFIVAFQQSIINTPEIGLPTFRPHCTENSWEVIGTTVQQFVIFAETTNLGFSHLAELLEQIWVHFVVDHVNEGP